MLTVCLHLLQPDGFSHLNNLTAQQPCDSCKTGTRLQQRLQQCATVNLPQYRTLGRRGGRCVHGQHVYNTCTSVNEAGRTGHGALVTQPAAIYAGCQVESQILQMHNSSKEGRLTKYGHVLHLNWGQLALPPQGSLVQDPA